MFPQKQKSPPGRRAFKIKPGDFLLSHTLARAVPSGLRGLTSVFGMGTGGSLSLWSPRIGVREKHPHELGELNIDGPQKENTAVFTINFMVKPNEQLVTVSSHSLKRCLPSAFHETPRRIGFLKMYGDPRPQP